MLVDIKANVLIVNMSQYFFSFYRATASLWLFIWFLDYGSVNCHLPALFSCYAGFWGCVRFQFVNWDNGHSFPIHIKISKSFSLSYIIIFSYFLWYISMPIFIILFSGHDVLNSSYYPWLFRILHLQYEPCVSWNWTDVYWLLNDRIECNQIHYRRRSRGNFDHPKVQNLD